MKGSDLLSGASPWIDVVSAVVCSPLARTWQSDHVRILNFQFSTVGYNELTVRDERALRLAARANMATDMVGDKDCENWDVTVTVTLNLCSPQLYSGSSLGALLSQLAVLFPWPDLPMQRVAGANSLPQRVIRRPTVDIL